MITVHASGLGAGRIEPGGSARQFDVRQRDRSTEGVKTVTKHVISRRSLLRDAAWLGGGAFILSACTGDSAGGTSSSGSGLPDIEGGEVITDPSRFPTSFRESPEFAQRVAAGELPPVAERIGQDPLVIQPVHEIGTYGGTIRRGFIGAEDLQNANLFCAGPDNLLYWDYRHQTIVPNVARGHEWNRDFTELTLHLRRGMQWSDGEPFTADDIIFWHEDINLNPAVGSGAPELRVDGEDVVIDKADDYTVVFRCPAPYAALPELLAGLSLLGGQSYAGPLGGGGFAPKHYLEQFHPKSASEQQATTRAKEAGFESWGLYLLNQNSWYLNPDLPTLTPWVVTRPINDPPWQFAANPYSIWVDIEGNQLPYIGGITMRDTADTQVMAARAAAGEYDFQDRGLDVKSLPVLVKEEDSSDYTIHQAPGEAIDAAVMLNLAYDKDPEIGELLRTVEFRRALSLGVDRHQINETFFLGTSVETVTAPAETSDFFLGEEWRTKWATHDVNQANQLLDDIGLTERDDDGFRRLPSGDDRIRLVIESAISKVDFPAIGENVRRQWQQLGIDAISETVDGILYATRIATNDVMMSVNFTIGTEDPSLAPYNLVPAVGGGASSIIGAPYIEWFLTDGASGTEPPESLALLAEAVELYREGLQTTRDERIEPIKRMCELHADQVWTIGLVGFGLANYGLYCAKNNLGNVPARINNSTQLRNPTIALPMTFYYK
jgi:peptide/nickel transport system substrate-binding protein